MRSFSLASWLTGSLTEEEEDEVEEGRVTGVCTEEDSGWTPEQKLNVFVVFRHHLSVFQNMFDL